MAVETEKESVANDETLSEGEPDVNHLDTMATSLVKFRCLSPSGDIMESVLNDNEDGTYAVDVNASQPGVHTIDVELDDQPIPGSPFLVRFKQITDKESIKISGPGLQSGVIWYFQGLLNISTNGAGAGELSVQIRGPKGGFGVQISRDEQQDRVVNVNYNPSLQGVYTINVLWSCEHVAGSPYEVFIAPDEDALSRWHDDPTNFRNIQESSEE